MRDIVTVRMLADPQDAPHSAHPCERIGLNLRTHVRQGTSLHAERTVQVIVVDASRGGLCVAAPAQLAVGDVLPLESPQQPDSGADFEVLRTDPTARNGYGGRLLELEAGSAVFEQLVESARAERAARRLRPSRKPRPTTLPAGRPATTRHAPPRIAQRLPDGSMLVDSSCTDQSDRPPSQSRLTERADDRSELRRHSQRSS